MVKRAVDVVLSALGLVLVAPLLGLIAIVVKLDSPGSVWFRQERVGLRGQPFEILKFRTMHVGARGPRVTAAGDGRVTRTGAWLRSTKLDELPQLVNVLRGEMSLVGPRPELPEYVACWPADERKIILSVRPGMTDPAAIANRRESEMLADHDDPERRYIEVLLPRKAALYVQYVRERTLLGDCRLIARTILTLVRG